MLCLGKPRTAVRVPLLPQAKLELARAAVETQTAAASAAAKEAEVAAAGRADKLLRAFSKARQVRHGASTLVRRSHIATTITAQSAILTLSAWHRYLLV